MAQNKFEFIAQVGGKILRPKGLYYQGKHVILVGDTEEGHTIRRKELISDVNIEIVCDNPFPTLEIEGQLRFLKSAKQHYENRSGPIVYPPTDEVGRFQKKLGPLGYSVDEMAHVPFEFLTFKGTGGGWSVGASGLSVISKDAGVIVSYAGSRDTLSVAEQEANVKLSAAAPALLAALKEMVLEVMRLSKEVPSLDLDDNTLEHIGRLNNPTINAQKVIKKALQ